ncbi:S8 family serine peptidase [Promicromonospora iranensis]|uniref:Subtilisin family serine protease n=1 Tax=Promicromonospora iranensis TaxID=1105144 RepID=A0ABU2CKG8_9MICO|nr:S8 family serine peptidase [Promicromonospora iranensis]MDR7381833.1 subtilisin family serine protease [Promicromonospora iranensis]
MPRRRAPIALAAVGALLATAVSVTPALASTPAPAGVPPTVTTDVPERPADKISPAVQTRLDAKESADFWIRFADAADLEPAKDIADWGERGQFVYDALTSTATASQADVVADLETAGVDYETYWISNAILVEDGTEALAKQVAASREVEQVHERFVAQQIEPVERKAPTRNAPLATEWGLDAIGAPDVWDMGYTGDGITVANIDSGVDVEHPALVEHYRGYLGDEGLSNDYNWFDASGSCDGAPCDIDAHGTHVMGTMVGDDGQGNQIGVAPDADWIAANGCATCSDADLLASGQWILAPTRADGSDPDPSQRPHVVNNSWGQVMPGAIDDFMSEEIAAWEAAGIFGAWAAGNAGEAGCASTSSPGANVATYASGAFGESGEIADFSSRGPGEDGETKPNLAAPGDEVRSSVPGGDYAEFSGTSMASPHLAGAVALLWSAAPVLVGDIEATQQLLDQTSVDVADDTCGGTTADNNVWGEGKLDVQALVSNAPIDGYGFLAGTVTGPDGEPVAGARVTVGERSDTTDAEGAYRLGLEEGPYEVSVSAFGFLDATAEVEVVEGETTTLDLGLEAAPTTTVSGTVTDGSGHGWPLDAKVAVQGAPSSVVAWTDPFTGEYSFELPQSTTHTLVVQPSVTGYGTLTQDVEVGTEPASADVATPVLSECTAPGYAMTGAGSGVEEFESGEVPDGWTVEDLAGTEQVWTFDDAFGYGNMTGGEGLFAEVNSDGYGDDGTQDTTLTSSSYDLTDVEAPLLTFDQSYLATGDFADVDVSVDGGETWETALHQTSDAEGRAIVALTGAGGESDVRVRFHYGDAAFGLWWQVDNVSIGQCLPVDGGLVAGFVHDLNTGDGVNGATVTAGAEESTRSVDPANPGVGAGYYSLFSTGVGEQQIGYTAKDYTGTEATVIVAADAITRQDVELAAPLLTVSPEELSRQVRMGGTRSGTFTVTNEGTAPADVEVAPGSSDFEILGSTGGTGVIQGTTHDTTEVSTASSGAKRSPAAKDGETYSRNGKRPGATGTPSAPPSLLAGEGTTITHSSSQDITMGNSVACGSGQTQWLRTFTLEDFDIDGEFAVTDVSFGVESVFAATDVTVNLYELDGELVYSNMTLLGSSDVALEPQELTMVDVPVTGTAPAGSTLVVEVVGVDGEIFIGSNAEPETAPSYIAAEECGNAEPATLEEIGFPDMHTVLNVTGETTVEVPWLDVQPPAFTLEPGQSTTVHVDLDSSRVDQPGTYTSAVVANGGTPYDEPRVQVSLSVTPLASWGKITGTVTGATCDDETVPLEGAFVVIDGSEHDVTLVTGADGGYARWMGVSNNRLTLLSSATGYPPETKSARIIKGQTVVHDFELNEFCD